MKNQPIFSWDAETGVASCILDSNAGVFVGTAKCHPDDVDMQSEKTGCEIAYRRAYINMLRHYRDNEIKPALAALKQLYYTMNRSKRFNEKSYENVMLQRQIRLKELDLDTTREMLATKEESLRSLITEKEKFYQRIRKNRKANTQ